MHLLCSEAAINGDCTKAAIHQVATMLSTSKNDLFPGHNHLLTAGVNDLASLRAISKVSGHQHWWLAGDDLERGHFRGGYRIYSMVVTWWIVAFFAQWVITTCGKDMLNDSLKQS